MNANVWNSNDNARGKSLNIPRHETYNVEISEKLCALNVYEIPITSFEHRWTLERRYSGPLMRRFIVLPHALRRS